MNSVPRATAPRRRTFQRFIAWILVSVGTLFTLMALTMPEDPTDPNDKAGRVGVLVFAVVMLGGGLLWLFMSRRSDARSGQRYAERAILEVAARHAGRATVAQISLETDLSTEQIEATLNSLSSKNIAQPDLLDDGSVVYLFGMLRG